MIALQILNMSIDITAAQSNTASSGDYNYIDTYIEYIAEIILKYENAIPESKHRGQKELQSHKQLQVICQSLSVSSYASLPGESLLKVYPGYINKYACEFIKEVNLPPPKSMPVA